MDDPHERPMLYAALAFLFVYSVCMTVGAAFGGDWVLIGFGGGVLLGFIAAGIGWSRAGGPN